MSRHEKRFSKLRRQAKYDYRARVRAEEALAPHKLENEVLRERVKFEFERERAGPNEATAIRMRREIDPEAPYARDPAYLRFLDERVVNSFVRFLLDEGLIRVETKESPDFELEAKQYTLWVVPEKKMQKVFRVPLTHSPASLK